MVGIECLSKISPICISEKLGLYIKNIDEKYNYTEVKGLLIDDFNKEIDKHDNFRKKIISCFSDDYYDGLLKNNLLKLNTNQLLTLISKYVIVFDYRFSDKSIITDDEIFDRCDENNILAELQKTPLINPIDEYEIEYKFLYLYNFVKKWENDKRDNLNYIFYTGYPDWQKTSVFNNFITKTYSQRKKHFYGSYKYYDNYNLEFESKIDKLIEFGKKYDKTILNSEEYFKMDFIIENLISAEKNHYSIMNYILLIEMLIVNPTNNTRNEFKNKIQFFVDDSVLQGRKLSDIENMATSFYDIRSRIAHGNFNSLKKELIKFKKAYMKNYSFDYGEFKEENWIINHISAMLKDIVQNILISYFDDSIRLYEFKFGKISII